MNIIFMLVTAADLLIDAVMILMIRDLRRDVNGRK